MASKIQTVNLNVDSALLEALRPIAKILAGLVAAELAERTAPVATHYSTMPCGSLPPGRSRRWLREHARHIPGVLREGPARGRAVFWHVPVAAYAAWHASQLAVVSTPTLESEDAIFDRLAATSGVRRTA